MAQDLTSSQIDRQNILNNKYALQNIRQSLDITPIEYKGVFYLTKQMVAEFYEVDFKLSGLKDINVSKNTPQLGIFDFPTKTAIPTIQKKF